MLSCSLHYFHCFTARIKFGFIADAEGCEIMDNECAIIEEDVLMEVISLKKAQPGFVLNINEKLELTLSTDAVFMNTIGMRNRFST
jgi:hypothetical protein